VSVIRLIGIWDDGSPRSGSVPTNIRREIQLVQNETTEIFLSLVTPSGEPKEINISGANRVLFTLKVKPGTGAVLTKDAASEPGAGEYKFTILPNDTNNTRPRRMFYDAWGTEGSVQMAVIPMSPANLVPSLAEF
jgi:hypothetical protein